MTANASARPYENTTMAVFLRKQIDTLSSIGISQREIALAAGYDKPNIFSMFKRGDTKVPLNKVTAIAKAMRVDPSFLFRLAAQQPDMPVTAEEIDKIFGNTVTMNEMAVVKVMRDVTHNTDPKPNDAQLERIGEFLGETFAPKKSISPVPKSL